MKAEIKGGKITLDLYDLVHSLSLEECAEVARQVVADEHLFAAVLDCVVTGSFFEDAPDGHWWFDSRRVLELREKLLPLMPEIAREAVKAALHQRDEAKAEAERHRSWAYRMYHAWPDSHWSQRPKGPDDWKPTPKPSDAEIDALMTQPAPPLASNDKEGNDG